LLLQEFHGTGLIRLFAETNTVNKQVVRMKDIDEPEQGDPISGSTID
jgi:hypothetical protein